MSAVSDRIAAINTALADAKTRVQTLKDELARNGATPDDFAAFDAIEAGMKDLGATEPMPPTPAPVPPTEPMPPVPPTP